MQRGESRFTQDFCTLGKKKKRWDALLPSHDCWIFIWCSKRWILKSFIHMSWTYDCKIALQVGWTTDSPQKQAQQSCNCIFFLFTWQVRSEKSNPQSPGWSCWNILAVVRSREMQEFKVFGQEAVYRICVLSVFWWLTPGSGVSQVYGAWRYWRKLLYLSSVSGYYIYQPSGFSISMPVLLLWHLESITIT